MKKYILATSLILSAFTTQAKVVGTQYNYLCENEEGTFELSILKSGTHMAVKIDNEYVDADSIEIQPKLGSKKINLYFLGAPGEDEQSNECQLTYTNAR